jgi:hypothetical protein
MGGMRDCSACPHGGGDQLALSAKNVTLGYLICASVAAQSIEHLEGFGY